MLVSKFLEMGDVKMTKTAPKTWSGFTKRVIFYEMFSEYVEPLIVDTNALIDAKEPLIVDTKPLIEI